MSAENPKIFKENQDRSRYNRLLDDETIETMKQYFKVEDGHLLDYIKNRIPHDALIES
jgi:hypothetical protein